MDKSTKLPQWLGILLMVVLLPWILLFLLGYLGYGLLLHLAVWMFWLPRGKSILIVTSDHPVWAQYMADRVVSLLQQEAFVLNWSERNRWPRFPNPPVMVFRYFGGSRDFNPLVVVFRPLRIAKVFRFWKPFKEYKKGRDEALEAVTEQALRYSGKYDISSSQAA